MANAWKIAVLLSLGSSFLTPARAEVSLEQDSEGVTVRVDGQPFTRYLLRSGAKPILWPVVGPSGKSMTRGYPMQPATADERDDHVHQRSFWFTHGNVNGIDFWGEARGHGTIAHREFVKVQSGPQAVVVARNDWLGPEGNKICEDERTLVFGADRFGRWVDFQVVVTASEGPVTFGDTKEGSFGVRVAGSMDVTAGKGGKIVNSEGQTDLAAWGQRAAWVDYSGPVDGETVGIAILNHPTSFRFPTYWHVRPYGLFAANPFGLRDFKGSDQFDGSHVMNKGESFTLKHRVLFHVGDAHQAAVAEAYAAYASGGE
jgi:hypothetical protein